MLYVDHGAKDARSLRVSSFLSAVASTTDCPLHRLSSQWIDSMALSALVADLKCRSAETKRNTLLICGSHLEDQVSVCALEALLEGFDVHLLCDMTVARDVKLKPVLLLRLFQAGAVPSSLRQFLFMWLAAEMDQNMKATLHKLLESYDFTFAGRPR